MMDVMKQMQEWDGTAFPEMLRSLPEIEVPMDGVRAWLLQGPTSQMVFFDISKGAVVPPHSHAAQWGLMVEGEMELTIGDDTRTIRKGDWYYIPKDVVHSATFPVRVSVIDVFDQVDRYKTKE